MKKNEREFAKSVRPILYADITNGKNEKLKELIKEHSNLANIALNWGYVHVAAEHNNVEALKVFIDAGIHPDSISIEHGPLTTPLSDAISNGAYDAASFLLDAGADIQNTMSGRAPSPIIEAAWEGDLKMVKMLLNRGADIHATYLRDGKERFNALKWAMINDHHEVADYLRSQGAVMLEEYENENTTSPDPDEELLADLSDYFKCKHLPLGIAEIVSASVPLTVYIFSPVKGVRDSTVFVTSGLIEYALVVPQGKEKYWYAEYFIEMPGAWPVKDKDLDKEKYFWPIRWLKAISRYPHENETYYGEKKTVKSAKIPALTTPDGNYDSALIERCKDMTFRVTQDERLVVYYRITPLCSSKKS